MERSGIETTAGAGSTIARTDAAMKLAYGRESASRAKIPNQKIRRRDARPAKPAPEPRTPA
jgi:hypothetical protein